VRRFGRTTIYLIVIASEFSEKWIPFFGPMPQAPAVPKPMRALMPRRISGLGNGRTGCESPGTTRDSALEQNGNIIDNAMMDR
jgi:hypothetical protein